ncbi:Protein Cmaq, partial [Clarias magur]
MEAQSSEGFFLLKSLRTPGKLYQEESIQTRASFITPLPPQLSSLSSSAASEASSQPTSTPYLNAATGGCFQIDFTLWTPLSAQSSPEGLT